jgi:cytochrome c2
MALAITMAVGAGTAHADGDAAKGEKIFAKCKACHTVEAVRTRSGQAWRVSLAGSPEWPRASTIRTQ